MVTKISKKELTDCLNNLKELLANLDYSNIYNVIFYNFDSYIKFINIQCDSDNYKKYSVEEILTKIERFIPFDFDEKTIDFLITSAIDDYDPIAFQSILINRAKVDFINMIKTASTKEQWQDLTNKCKHIHEYHEINGILYM